MDARHTRSNQAIGRVAVVGAGAAGLACAWRLAREGFEIVLIESEASRQNALWASGGMLAAGFECAVELDNTVARACDFAALATQSADLWPGWAQRLEDETSHSIGYERFGSLTPIFTAEESVRAAQAMEQARGFGIEVRRLNPDEVANAEPCLAPSLGALEFPGDGQLDNRALGEALHAALQARGVKIVTGEAVALIYQASRVVGVRLSEDRQIKADAVVIATGAGRVLADATLPEIEPVKGQMIAFAATRPFAPRRIIRGFTIYMAAKPGHRLIAGATSEPGRADIDNDDAAVEHLAEAARAVAPGLTAIPVRERWAGLRPKTQDAMPIIGQSAPGLVLALGGYRNGVLLAPAIAQAVTHQLMTGERSQVAAAFAPNRFQAER